MPLQINGGDHVSQEISIPKAPAPVVNGSATSGKTLWMSASALGQGGRVDTLACICNWSGLSKRLRYSYEAVEFFLKRLRPQSAVTVGHRCGERQVPSATSLSFGLGHKCLFLPQSASGKARRMGAASMSSRPLEGS